MDYRAILNVQKIRKRLERINKSSQENKNASDYAYNCLLEFLNDVFKTDQNTEFPELNIFKIIEGFYLPVTDNPNLIISSWVLGVFFKVFMFYRDQKNPGISRKDENNQIREFVNSEVFKDDSMEKYDNVCNFLENILFSIEQLKTAFVSDENGSISLNQKLRDDLFKIDKIKSYIFYLRCASKIVPLLGTFLVTDNLLYQEKKENVLGHLYNSLIESKNSDLALLCKAGFFEGDNWTFKNLALKIDAIKKNKFAHSFSTIDFYFQVPSEYFTERTRNEKIKELRKMFFNSPLIGVRVDYFDSIFLLENETIKDQPFSDNGFQDYLEKRRLFAKQFIEDFSMNSDAIKLIEKLQCTQDWLKKAANLICYYHQNNPTMVIVLLALMRDVYDYAKSNSFFSLKYIEILNIQDENIRNYFVYLFVHNTENFEDCAVKRFLKYNTQKNSYEINRIQIDKLYLDVLFKKMIYSLVRKSIHNNSFISPNTLIYEKLSVTRNFSKVMPYLIADKKNCNSENKFNRISFNLTSEMENEIFNSLYYEDFQKFFQSAFKIVNIGKNGQLLKFIEQRLKKNSFFIDYKITQGKLTIMEKEIFLIQLAEKIKSNRYLRKEMEEVLIAYYLLLLIEKETGKQNEKILYEEKELNLGFEKIKEKNIFHEIRIKNFFIKCKGIFDNKKDNEDEKLDKLITQTSILLYSLTKEKGITWNLTESFSENFFLVLEEKILKNKQWKETASSAIVITVSRLLNYKNNGFLQSNSPEEDMGICKDIVANLHNVAIFIPDIKSISYIERHRVYEFIHTYILFFEDIYRRLSEIVLFDNNSELSGKEKSSFTNDEETILKMGKEFCDEFKIDQKKSGLMKWIDEENKSKYYVEKEKRWKLYLPFPVILGIFSVLGLSGILSLNESENIFFKMSNNTGESKLFLLTILFAVLSLTYIASQILKSHKIKLSKLLIRSFSMYSSFLFCTKIIVCLFFFISGSLQSSFDFLFVFVLGLGLIINLSIARLLMGYTEWTYDPKQNKSIRGIYYSKLCLILFLCLCSILLLVYSNEKKAIFHFYGISNLILFLSLVTQLFFNGMRMLINFDFHESSSEKLAKLEEIDFKLYKKSGLWFEEILKYVRKKILVILPNNSLYKEKELQSKGILLHFIFFIVCYMAFQTEVPVFISFIFLLIWLFFLDFSKRNESENVFLIELSSFIDSYGKYIVLVLLVNSILINLPVDFFLVMILTVQGLFFNLLKNLYVQKSKASKKSEFINLFISLVFYFSTITYKDFAYANFKYFVLFIIIFTFLLLVLAKLKLSFSSGEKGRAISFMVLSVLNVLFPLTMLFPSIPNGILTGDMLIGIILSSFLIIQIYSKSNKIPHAFAQNGLLLLFLIVFLSSRTINQFSLFLFLSVIQQSVIVFITNFLYKKNNNNSSYIDEFSDKLVNFIQKNR